MDYFWKKCTELLNSIKNISCNHTFIWIQRNTNENDFEIIFSTCLIMQFSKILWEMWELKLLIEISSF